MSDFVDELRALIEKGDTDEALAIVQERAVLGSATALTSQQEEAWEAIRLLDSPDHIKHWHEMLDASGYPVDKKSFNTGFLAGYLTAMNGAKLIAEGFNYTECAQVFECGAKQMMSELFERD